MLAYWRKNENCFAQRQRKTMAADLSTRHELVGDLFKLPTSNESLLAGVPTIEKGKPMQGQFFPLLYDPAAQSV
ncbi:MAG: hypothetical protein CMJ64_09690 [Planctomycetaceae bacterium]|nr:hypothetical protein [Planctomycetaceae bacterium]